MCHNWLKLSSMTQNNKYTNFWMHPCWNPETVTRCNSRWNNSEITENTGRHKDSHETIFKNFYSYCVYLAKELEKLHSNTIHLTTSHHCIPHLVCWDVVALCTVPYRSLSHTHIPSHISITRFISGKTLNANMGNWFSLKNSLSWSCDTGLLSYLHFTQAFIFVSYTQREFSKCSRFLWGYVL